MLARKCHLQSGFVPKKTPGYILFLFLSLQFLFNNFIWSSSLQILLFIDFILLTSIAIAIRLWYFFLWYFFSVDSMGYCLVVLVSLYCSIRQEAIGYIYEYNFVDISWSWWKYTYMEQKGEVKERYLRTKYYDISTRTVFLLKKCRYSQQEINSNCSEKRAKMRRSIPAICWYSCYLISGWRCSNRSSTRTTSEQKINTN